MSYKTTDGLMRHLRNTGIAIAGSTQKRNLLNTGYFHGYKGYRFFEHSNNRLPFSSYDEVYATIQYDSKLKALFYSKIMFIETALKNLVLESVLIEAHSESIQAMMDKVICGYKNAPHGSSADQKKKFQQNKLNLLNSIQANIARAYKAGNPQITHFYNNAGYTEVPIWALFEILTMGDFGFLLSCMTYDARDSVANKLGIGVARDTNRELVHKYIYTLKDLRNAVAHNHVVFDTRFRNIDPTKAMCQCLVQEIGLPFVNFKSIGDYVILMCFILKLLHVPKTEIKAFIRDFERTTDEYRKAVSSGVASMVIRKDLPSRLALLRNFV